jgi:hypothetical protein
MNLEFPQHLLRALAYPLPAELADYARTARLHPRPPRARPSRFPAVQTLLAGLRDALEQRPEGGLDVRVEKAHHSSRESEHPPNRDDHNKIGKKPHYVRYGPARPACREEGPGRTAPMQEKILITGARIEQAGDERPGRGRADEDQVNSGRNEYLV